MADPLGHLYECFAVPDPGLVYLDGNSLGRLPFRTKERIRQVVEEQWGDRLIRSWNEAWLDLPRRAGDTIGRACLGAADGQVVLADSTTVNFYKLAAAALIHAAPRQVVVTDNGNFPTDRYVVEGLAAAHGATARLVDFDDIDGPTPETVAAVLDSDVALLTLSAVDYRSGALADVAGITEVAHRAGALVLWDLSHAAGAVPLDLDAAGVDLAVGCTYKYLNGGPGAPAYLYVRKELQSSLMPPIWGWYGQRDQFAMGPGFAPLPDIGRFLSGTPSVIGAACAEEGAALVAEAGIDRLRNKGMA